MSAMDNSAQCRMFNSRIVDRMVFSAETQTAGLNPQNSLLSRDRLTSRARKQYPRKSNLTFGYAPLRFPSVDGFDFDHPGFPGLKVNCAMNVDALTPARLLDHELVLFWRPTADWPRRMGQMHGIGEQHGLVVAQGIHELFIACDESLLQFFVKLARDDVWLVIGQTQAMTAQSVPNGFRKPGRIAS
jgi:hypothetical protein